MDFTYMPVKNPRNSCPRCKSKIALHELEGIIVTSVQEAERRIQEQQDAIHGMLQPGASIRPVEQVLLVLRSYQSDCPQWLPIYLRPREDSVLQGGDELWSLNTFLDC